mmetsp:Transcript_17349/g.45279  ORF Transcript_17349/g.45279 Transcript_17349/m.45279 type:complete len:200 (-) Transcript_17349:165-764(-)
MGGKANNLSSITVVPSRTSIDERSTSTSDMRIFLRSDNMPRALRTHLYCPILYREYKSSLLPATRIMQSSAFRFACPGRVSFSRARRTSSRGDSSKEACMVLSHAAFSESNITLKSTFIFSPSLSLTCSGTSALMSTTSSGYARKMAALRPPSRRSRIAFCATCTMDRRNAPTSSSLSSAFSNRRSGKLIRRPMAKSKR